MVTIVIAALVLYSTVTVNVGWGLAARMNLPPLAIALVGTGLFPVDPLPAYRNFS
jgi:hypothetical protein